MLSQTPENLVAKLCQIQKDFYKTFGVNDIITNSKIFEVLIADSLGHTLIPGHTGTRDGKDDEGNEYEYKHFKESSSNHTWTFNDFSDSTILKLRNVRSVIFAHIDDTDDFPKLDWYYEVPGIIVSDYLRNSTPSLKNNRKMTNISPKQIESILNHHKKINSSAKPGPYKKWIEEIILVIKMLEDAVGTKGILTSNKFWEVLVAIKLKHKVQSVQSKHDAENESGDKFEYKVGIKTGWGFQDISKEVLKKYLDNEAIVLAQVDKDNFLVKRIYLAKPKRIVTLLRRKLREKIRKYKLANKEVRRRHITVSTKSVKLAGGKIIFPKS